MLMVGCSTKHKSEIAKYDDIERRQYEASLKEYWDYTGDAKKRGRMRHVLVHGYYKIRPKQLWETIAVDIPQLKPTIERLIKEHE